MTGLGLGLGGFGTKGLGLGLDNINPLFSLFYDHYHSPNFRVFVSVRARDVSSRSWADCTHQRQPLSIRGHL